MSVIRPSVKTTSVDYVSLHDREIEKCLAEGLPQARAALMAMVRCKIEWIKRNPIPRPSPLECAYCGKRKNLIPAPSLGQMVMVHDECLVPFMAAVSDRAEMGLREAGLEVEP